MNRYLKIFFGLILLALFGAFFLFFAWSEKKFPNQINKGPVATHAKPKTDDPHLQESKKDAPQSSGVASLPGTTTPNTQPSFVKADGSPLPNVIYLNAGPIDTDLPGTKARRQPLAYFSGKQLQLIQWNGPVQAGWIDELNRLGVEIIDYIPENAFLVYGDWKVLSAMQKKMADKDYVRWEGSYRPTDKIQPGALDASREEPDLFAVQMVLNPQSNPETLKTIRSLQISETIKEEPAGKYYNVITRLPPVKIANLAERPDIISIGPYTTPKMFCERQAIIMAGQLNGNVPVLGSGYLTWLAGKGFTQAQFDASGLVVDVTDSPIDNGTVSPNHFALYKGGDIVNVSRMVYSRLEGTANSGSSTQAVDGHGNLNAHIIGGQVNLSTSPHVDSSGFHFGMGICPFVKVGGSIIFDTSSFTNPNYPNLAARAYRDGVRISSNSWGADTAGAYDVDAQSYDALVRDAQPTGSAVATAGNQQMTFVFAAGNAGSGTKTVGSPGTAKNVITVGAAENVQAFGGADSSGVADNGADSPNDIIDFSSRGPCSDSRAKPDIVAPGTHISGGVPQAVKTMSGTGTKLSVFDGSGVSGGVSSIYFPSAGQQFYTASSGTSHSTPGVAGGAALVYQWFLNRGSAAPSPAMVKGFMMNSARYMTGVSANDNLYSNNQGMGMVNLDASFDGVPRLLRDQVTADLFTATGQSRTWTGTVTSAGKPFRVTVAWTDAPGSTTGNAYKNNLDLTVVVNGTTYKGNVFTGANSTAGGVADARNNVESVFLPAGTSGNVTITVAATNINSDGVPNYGTTVDQDFALVAYNFAEGNPAPTVVMTAPTEGTTVLPNAPVTLTATATDLTLTGSAGVVSKVEFFDGTTSLGSVSSAPYSVVWTPTISGVHVLTAKATDSESAVGISPAVNLRVLSGSGQPTLASFSPTSGVAGSLVTISGDNFAVGAGTSVKFNGVDAVFTVDSLNQITATVPASATTGVITVTTAYGTVTSLGNYTVVPIVLSEDFSALTSGDNTTTSGSSTAWTGNTLFPTVVRAYQAGGAVKLGTSNVIGSITSKTLDLSSGPFDVSFDVKGWNSAGEITVTANGQTQNVTYTSIMSGSFETKILRFSAGTANTTITLSTTSATKRAFLDNIIVTKAASAVSVPVISSSLTQTGTVGAAFNYQITASGSPTSYGATGLPGGLGINTSTGAITGTPTVAGTSNVTISATNSSGTGSATLVITVNSSASAPVISSSLAASATVGTAFTYQIEANGSTPTSYGATGLPEGLSVNASGTITGTPTVAGTSNVTISATNGSGTGSATLVITVSPSGGGGGSSGLIAGWDFQTSTSGGTIVTVSPNSPLSYTANFGTGTIYLDGSNGSSTWTSLASNPEVTSFSGTAVNAGTGFSTTTTSPACLALANSSANGKKVIFKFSMSGRKDLIISYATQRTGTGFTTHLWETSVDGSNWTPAQTMAITATSFAVTTLTTISSLDNASSAYLRLTLTGATAVAGNNRLDNIQLNATAAATTPTVSVSGTLAAVNTTYGTASSAPTSFTVSGSNLTAAILVSAPLGYEISQTPGGASGYAPTQTVGAPGTVAGTTIYARLQATAPVGTYSGNITCNSAGSAGANVATVGSSVAKKQITISGLVGLDKEYDTTNSAGVTGTPTYVGLVNGDALSVTGVANATFADKNVGINKTVTISGFTDPNGNYTVTAPTVTASITPKEVVILGLSGVNKTYDGTSSGALSGTASLLGVVAADQPSVILGGTPLVSFVSANASPAVEMVVSGYALNGAEAANYTLIQPIGLAADITPKPATIVANDRFKVSGTTLVLGSGQTEFTSSGLISGERIGSVTLMASGGTEAGAPRGIYSITPSDPVAAITIPSNTFRQGNYEMTYIQGILSVIDAPTTITLSDWADQNGLTGLDALPDSDPDKDGMSNLMEYYLGLSPTSSSGSGGVFSVSKGSNNTVSFTYRRAKGVTGVSAEVQATGDLSSSWGTNGVQETVVDKGTYEEVTATVTNAPGETKKFMRLRVTAP